MHAGPADPDPLAKARRYPSAGGLSRGGCHGLFSCFAHSKYSEVDPLGLLPCHVSLGKYLHLLWASVERQNWGLYLRGCACVQESWWAGSGALDVSPGPSALASLMGSETFALWAPEGRSGAVPPQRPPSPPSSTDPSPFLCYLGESPHQGSAASAQNGAPVPLGLGTLHLSCHGRLCRGHSLSAGPMAERFPQGHTLRHRCCRLSTPLLYPCLASGQTSSPVTCFAHSSCTGQGFLRASGSLMLLVESEPLLTCP